MVGDLLKISILDIAVSLELILLLGIYYVLNKQIRQRRQAEIVLAQQREKEKLINQIAQQIRQSLNLTEVLSTTVAEVKKFLECDRVLIYRIWEDGTGSTITETVSAQYPQILGESFPEEVFPTEYHQAYIQGKIRIIDDLKLDSVEPCLAEFLAQFSVKAKLVVPIVQQVREIPATGQAQSPYLWGLLIAHQCETTREWQSGEIDLMQQLATQVAIAIQQSEIYEQLQKLNRELEQRVKTRTQELANINQTLESLIKASPRAIFTLDLAEKVKIWNPAAERMFGWSEAELRDHPNPIISTESVPEYQEIRQTIAQKLTPKSLEISRYKKDGSPIEIVFSAAPLVDSQDQLTGMVAVVADISEQKRQAEQVRLLQSVVVNTNDAILITEAEPINEPGPKIIYVNEAFTRTTGYSLEEVLGKTPRILQGAKTNRQALDKVRKALETWQPVTVETVNYRKDGSEFWVEFSIVAVSNKQGHYTHWISVQRDITERKRTESALRRSDERFRRLVENALDIITIIDLTGYIHYGSPSVAQVLGYQPTQLAGKRFFDYIHPEDRASASQGIIQVLQQTTPIVPIEFRCQHENGSWRVLEAVSQKFIDDTPEPRIVINSRDITERKRLEEVRLALGKERELSAMKTRFFSMASHEFRTPLSTALAAAQLLENSASVWQDESKRIRNLTRIQDSVKNMVQLLDDILTINRAETGKLEFNPKPIDLVGFCQQFIEEIQLSTDANHKLIFDCPQAHFKAYLDKKLLRSILANLLSNATKYSPQGGKVRIDLDIVDACAQIVIRDRGIGIPPEDMAQLFEPFNRGKNVARIPGTGLGLVVVKKCVDLHSGTINLNSFTNKGTTVIVTLPIDGANPKCDLS